ncbi:MAG: bifunctional oligoribonuclease/PAP phosphatase NrnA [Spirochaetaceae bacterium]|nr:bifunctional oligoribonuclease/PAP phosphatase NrnA [Spirochaetaceae bacterium]
MGDTTKLLDEDFSNFLTFVNKYEQFIIAGHKEPDGDCITSSLVLAELLNIMGKKTLVVSAGPFKRTEVKKYENQFAKNIDGFAKKDKCALFLVDCSLLERTGDVGISENQFDTFIIDHHKTAGKSTEKSIVKPAAPAAAYLIQQLFEHSGAELDKQTANLLFFGICTDTGFFRFLEENDSCVFEAVARLVSKGASPKKTYDEMTGNKPFVSRKVLGMLLDRTELFFNGRLALTYETYEETERFGKDSRDSDALYQMLSSSAGVEAIVSIKQEKPEMCTVGLRSKDAVDVSSVAAKYGGGGHKNAAGFSAETSIDALKQDLLKEFKKIFA